MKLIFKIRTLPDYTGGRRREGADNIPMINLPSSNSQVELWFLWDKLTLSSRNGDIIYQLKKL